MRDYLVVDTEFVGEPWEGSLLAVGVMRAGDTEARVFPEWEIPDDVYDALEDPALPKVVFTKTDHRWLALRGVTIRGDVLDVQVMAWAVNEMTPLDLDWVHERYVGTALDKRIRSVGGKLLFRTDAGHDVPLADAPWDDLADYCARDVVATKVLFEKLLEGLAYDDLGAYWENECVPLSAVLVEMETRGLPVDLEESKKLRLKLEGEMEDLEDRLRAEGSLPPGFNLGSVDHLAAYLYEKRATLKGSVPIDADTRAALKEALAAGEAPVVDGLKVGTVGRAYAHGLYEFAGLGLKVRKKTDKGKPSTDAKTLQVHYGDLPWVQDLLAYKKRATVVQTFLRNFEAMAHDGRLFGRFNQTGTKTGRLSSSGPNLQNIPARGDLGHAVRSLFRPEPGFVFVHGDYSMLEPRLMAHLSQDPLLLTIFREDRDIYLETAKAIFGRDFTKDDPERALMKTYVLAMGYGAGAEKLQETLAVAGFLQPLEEVEATLKELQRVYARFFEWKEETIEEATEERYVVTLAGHRRRLANLRGKNARNVDSWREIGHDERAAVNARVQGSAQDVVARTMVNVSRNLPRLALLAQVHDELLAECRAEDAKPWVLRRLQAMAEKGHGFDLSVPLKFEPRVVATWAEGKD